MKPFPEGVFCGEVHQHVFGRQGGVSPVHPFFRGWGQSVGNQKKLEIVAFLVIACSSLAMGSEQEKLPDFLKVSAHDMVCQEIGGGGPGPFSIPFLYRRIGSRSRVKGGMVGLPCLPRHM